MSTQKQQFQATNVNPLGLQTADECEVVLMELDNSIDCFESMAQHFAEIKDKAREREAEYRIAMCEKKADVIAFRRDTLAKQEETNLQERDFSKRRLCVAKQLSKQQRQYQLFYHLAQANMDPRDFQRVKDMMIALEKTIQTGEQEIGRIIENNVSLDVLVTPKVKGKTTHWTLETPVQGYI